MKTGAMSRAARRHERAVVQRMSANVRIQVSHTMRGG